MKTMSLTRLRSRIYISTALAIAGLTFCLTSQANTAPVNLAQFSITFSPAGDQTAPMTVRDNASIYGVETFNDRALCGSGGQPACGTFTSNFLTDHKGGPISGTYSAGARILPPSVFGGAGGDTRFVSAFPPSLVGTGPNFYTVTLNHEVNYFGFWLSALDLGNNVMFLNNGVEVGRFSPQDLMFSLEIENHVGPCPTIAPGALTNPFCGNPNPNRQSGSGNSPDGFPGNRAELYAFVNFVDKSGDFNQLRFTQTPPRTDTDAQFESDNHTVALCNPASACITGTPVTPIPEPSTFSLVATALALAGLGFFVRRHKKAPASDQVVLAA